MDYAVPRNNMIKQQLKTNAITCPKTIHLFETLHREAFLPSSLAHFAYSDIPLPTDAPVTMMTPLQEATLLQSLELTGEEIVLEVGTGYGLFTALLSQCVKTVWSLDDASSLTLQGKKQLSQCNNVHLMIGPTQRGYPERAPYDVIVFKKAIPSLETLHQLQLNPNGKIFAPIQSHTLQKGMLFKTDEHDNWQQQFLFYSHFPSLLTTKTPSFVF